MPNTQVSYTMNRIKSCTRDVCEATARSVYVRATYLRVVVPVKGTGQSKYLFITQLFSALSQKIRPNFDLYAVLVINLAGFPGESKGGVGANVNINIRSLDLRSKS